jgi:MoxR-like ATPase
MQYALKLVMATQPDGDLKPAAATEYARLGASPRAAQALISGAKVRALINGRYNISYSDIQALAYPVLRHRVKINFEAITERVTPDDIIAEIIRELNKKEAI